MLGRMDEPSAGGGKRRADDAALESGVVVSKAARTDAAAGPGSDGSSARLQYAVSADKGTRPAMEDVHVCLHDEAAAGQRDSVSFFAVLDGHGGRDCAEFAAARLHEAVMAAGLLTGKGQQQPPANKPPAAEGTTGAAPASAAHYRDWELDVKVAKQAIIKGFLSTDAELLQQCTANNWQDGATAVAVWLVGATMCFVANIGDCKGVLARTSDKAGSGGQLQALVLTKDHLAIYPAERARITKAGGSISDGRLNGRIQVSRAFGDAQFKKSGSSASPDVTAFSICERDRFILCACDGFWSVMDPQGAVKLVQQQLEQGKAAKAITNRLLNEAVIERRCKDNCSVLLILLPQQQQQQQQQQQPSK